MPHDDDPPELRDHVPHDKPLRHPATVRVMRVAIVLGIVGLVVPGLALTAALQTQTAQRSCLTVVDARPDTEAVARFEVLGPAGPSWYCYAREFGGREVLIASLGLVPG